MYAVRRWDEEAVIKWLAVAMCLAMIGLAVMPMAVVGSKCFSVAWTYFVDHGRKPWKLGEVALKGALTPSI